MRHLICAMEARLGDEVAPCVLAADAEGPNEVDAGGFGVVGTLVDPELAEATYMKSHRPGRTVARLDGSVSSLVSGEKELRRTYGVSRVPRAVLELPQEKWEVLSSGRWRRREHITVGEARTTQKLFDAASTLPHLHRRVLAILKDNEPWSAACAKGRSPTYRINTILRRKVAIEAVAECSFFLPWTDTKHQPADQASRARSLAAAGGRAFHHDD